MRGRTHSEWRPGWLLAAVLLAMVGGLLLFAEKPERADEAGKGSTRKEDSARPAVKAVSKKVGEATTSQVGVASASQIFIEPANAGQELPARPVIDTHEGLREVVQPNGVVFLEGGNFVKTLKVKIGPEGEAHVFHTTKPTPTPSAEESARNDGNLDKKTTGSEDQEEND